LKFGGRISFPQFRIIVRLAHFPEPAFTFLRDDWRKAEYYQSHLDYDCVKWAGEWLWRNTEFRADLQLTSCCSRSGNFGTDGQVRIVRCTESCPMARWGLRCCRMDAGKPVFLWSSEFSSHVLSVEVEVATDAKNSIDLRQCSLLVTALHDAEQELNLLFSDGARTLQVVLRGASSLEGRFLPRCTLRGAHEFENKPLSLQRLCCLYKRGRLAKSLYPGEQRSRHWIDMLRACDGRQSGASYREICAAIFGEWAASDGWGASYRSRVQRLIRSAQQMVKGGYLNLLL
jgi:hypothetical protein